MKQNSDLLFQGNGHQLMIERNPIPWVVQMTYTVMAWTFMEHFYFVYFMHIVASSGVPLSSHCQPQSALGCAAINSGLICIADHWSAMQMSHLLMAPWWPLPIKYSISEVYTWVSPKQELPSVLPTVLHFQDMFSVVSCYQYPILWSMVAYQASGQMSILSHCFCLFWW